MKNFQKDNSRFSWLPDYMNGDFLQSSMSSNGTIKSLPLLESSASREEYLCYFHNGWYLTELLFSGLKNDDVFLEIPYHGLRHPLIFYYGHVAALYINKCRVAGLINETIDSHIESCFETGIDEMRWDDIPQQRSDWPALDQVRWYRQKTYELITHLIMTHPDIGNPNTTINEQHPLWALLMSFEHERIHLETSSVLIRELPISSVKKPEAWPEIIAEDSITKKKNSFCTVPQQDITLGKKEGANQFGWDNEYGQESHHVPTFETSTFLITNEEFLEFVKDQGYHQDQFWSEEGLNWRRFRNIKHPTFWVPTGPSGLHDYQLRTCFNIIKMPLSWPVCVNYHEAKAYCSWRSKRDNVLLTLPSEKQLIAIRDKGDNQHHANLGMAYGAETPVDFFSPNKHGVYGAMGNVWQWSSDVFHPLDGFKTHPYYTDFSTPCFDGQHQMILGGSFISTGDEASSYARFHFRPHFFQHAGFRIVIKNNASAAFSTGERHILGGKSIIIDKIVRHPHSQERWLLVHEEETGRTDALAESALRS